MAQSSPGVLGGWRISSAELQDIRGGDEAAFSRLVRLETLYLRNYARQWLVDTDDVEDVVQTTWFRVWSARETLTDFERWRRWATIVCRNACLDLLRRHRRTVAFTVVRGDGDAPFDPEAPPLSMSESAFSDETLSAILTLPVRQRLVVIWRYIAGKSTLETADILRCSPGTVKAALAQALRALRNRIPAPCEQSFESPRETRNP
jgi:RNA polymerase sigma-70 factor (ECF subfamily)